ncbi:AAA family ATPase [Aeromonas caviae]
MYLSALKIENFRQFGAAAHALNIQFNEGVTALVGENDAGKTAAIDANLYVLQTRDAEYLRLQIEDFHIANDGTQADTISLRCTLAGLSPAELGAFAEYVVATHKDGGSYCQIWCMESVRWRSCLTHPALVLRP